MGSITSVRMNLDLLIVYGSFTFIKCLRWISTRVWKIGTNWCYANFRVQNLFCRALRLDPHPIKEEMCFKWFIIRLREYLIGIVVESNCDALRRFRVWHFKLGSKKKLKEVVNRILSRNKLNDYFKCGGEVMFGH